MPKIDDFVSQGPDSPRTVRAHCFAMQVMALLRDFLPLNNPVVRRELERYLFDAGYKADAQIINTPPEYDALRKEQIERLMLEKLTKPGSFPKYF